MVTASVAGCGLFGGNHASPPASPAPVAPGSPVELRQTRDHPRLSLVERQGDPEAGAAIAVAHDLGSDASATLAELVALRVRRVLPLADAIAYGTGFSVRTLVTGDDEAARFVTATLAALSGAPTAKELSAVRARVDTLGMEVWSNEAERELGRCAGELGTDADANRVPATPEMVAAWLDTVRSARATAYAAVGPRAVLESVAAAVADTPSWPAGSELDDAWPAHDRFGASASAGRTATVSAAMRVADPAAALSAARSLAGSDSSLALRVDALAPGWTVESVVATSRPRGACIRVDLRATTPGASSSPEDAAGAAWLAFDELDRALSPPGGASAWSLDDGVLRSTDPREAAAVAAWRALSATLKAGPTRRFASFREPGGPDRAEAADAFALALERAVSQWKRPTVDVVTRVERGQGELWLLAATPCGTAPEGVDDAGLTALAVRALARAAPSSDVVIEPWVTPNGVGLLAHGPPLSGRESPLAHARRVAGALGRAMITPPPDETVAAARSHTLSELDADGDALGTTAFGALVPGHPSWLDPRGGWVRVSSATSESTRSEAHRLVTGPLRLAVIANHDRAQAGVAAGALSRWLRPQRSAQSRCTLPKVPVARPGSYVVETRPDGTEAVRAVVAVRTSPEASRQGAEADWTVYLLNRPSGWLHGAVDASGLTTTAHASLLGGSTAAAIVIEVAVPGADPAPAVAQVRALLSRLAAGAVTAADVTAAAAAFHAAHRRDRLDPRRRIVDTWTSLPPPPEPTLESMKHFHATAFADARHVVVVTRPKP